MVCPLCGRPLDAALLQIQPKVENHIVCILQEHNPGWMPVDGVCPECVHGAVVKAIAARSPTSLQDELHTPVPVYSKCEAQLIPTPARVHANPNFNGHGTTVGFLDSGFYPHPDLVLPNNRVVAYVDATGRVPAEKQGFKKPLVTSWHGLMTSTICAGNGFMSDGSYRGLAPEARLVLVRTGNQSGHGIRERDISRAFRWVLTNQERFIIRVINISLGGDHLTIGKQTELDELVEEAASRGIVVVAAAGNSGRYGIMPPASAPSAITVGGYDDQNHLEPHYRRMYWSSYGLGVGNVRKPDLIAPAMWLAAPMLPGTGTHNAALYFWQYAHASDAKLRKLRNSKYAQKRMGKNLLSLRPAELRHAIQEYMNEEKFIHPHYQHVDGTSMAAPIVSGIVAQMLEANPSLTPARIKEILMMTADPLWEVPPERQGAGAVNAGKAVAAALRADGGSLYGIPSSPQIAAGRATLYYHDPAAREVALVGSFNSWLTQHNQMVQLRPGVWEGRIRLAKLEAYRYKFLIDRSRWTHDPENPHRIEDGFGGFSSVINR
jgi:serine protease AprX